MGSAPPNNDENNVRLIEAIYRIVGQVERKFDALREADLDAARTLRLELSSRLDGFPELYATTIEFEQATQALRALETTVLARNIYEQNHKTLQDRVVKIDQEKLSEAVFDTFVENYRIDQDKATADRRAVVETLATATNQVREQVIAERSEYMTVESYQHQHSSLVQRVEGTERWQYKIVGGLVFATFIAPLVTGLVVYAVTKGF